MWGRLPLPQVAVAVTLGVVSGFYIYRPIFQSSGPLQPAEGTAGPPPDAAAEKRP